MTERETYEAANEAYQASWRNASGIRTKYLEALKGLEHRSPDDAEGLAPFVARFVEARTAIRAAEARTKVLLQEREAAYKALVAAGG